MNKKELNCASTFTFKEKLFAQFTYNAGVVVATYGLFLNNPRLAVAYLLFSYIGILLVVRYTICPRCPHLHEANDCVQLPAPIMKMIIASDRKGPLSITEKLLLPVVLYGTFMLPLYWIASNRLVLLMFIMLFGGHLLGLHIHFCKKCENMSCIQNKRAAG